MRGKEFCDKPVTQRLGLAGKEYDIRSRPGSPGMDKYKEGTPSYMRPAKVEAGRYCKKLTKCSLEGL